MHQKPDLILEESKKKALEFFWYFISFNSFVISLFLPPGKGSFIRCWSSSHQENGILPPRTEPRTLCKTPALFMFSETRWDRLNLVLCTFTFFLLKTDTPKVSEDGTPLWMPSELKHGYAGMEDWPFCAVRKQGQKCLLQFSFCSH